MPTLFKSYSLYHILSLQNPHTCQLYFVSMITLNTYKNSTCFSISLKLVVAAVVEIIVHLYGRN